MMFSKLSIAVFLGFAASNSYAEEVVTRRLGRGGRGQSTAELKIKLTNISYRQPFSPFFIMTSDESVPDVFKLGAPPNEVNGITQLAEEGMTGPMQTYYDGLDEGVGVTMVAIADPAGPQAPGTTIETTVIVDRRYPYVSLASMAIATNDCFVGINKMELRPGMRIMVPGYDAGTEENNECCDEVPPVIQCDTEEDGPRQPCDLAEKGAGEGFVHIHRGIHGKTMLFPESSIFPETYDWRNPMLMIEVEEVY